MAVSDSMFLFEVVLENVKSLVRSRELVMRAEFADVFSLNLKDPKQLNIVMPQPPPAPPEPPGKKGKKAKPPKPKGKKGKGAVEPPPPPEPVIQSGQSILIASSAEILLATMKNNPLSLSLWSKENELGFIGSANVPWDHQYVNFLETICNCQKPQPVTVKTNYNIFNEETAKLMATVTFQIKLTYLEDKITSQFRTVPNPTPGVKKFMYTGVHSKQTSYMCSMKISEKIDEGDDYDNSTPRSNPHMETTYVREQTPAKPPELRYADFKNAPATNTFFSDDADYCCVGKADKPPESIYKRPTVIPDLNFLADYVNKVIRSCNEDMRMLTPQPDIHTKHRSTDIDRLCGCHRTWPDSELADLMKNDPNNRIACALCSEPDKSNDQPNSFQLHNIRGPCGKVECKVAKGLRDYIEKLAAEDNKEIQLDDIVGPCGSRTCTLADRIQKFIRQEGVFSSGKTVEGLSTVCACEDKLVESLKPKNECGSECSNECGSDDDDSNCSETLCPYNKKRAENTYCVGYCTIMHDKDQNEPSSDESGNEYCKSDCPSIMGSPEIRSCTKSRCATPSESFSGVPCQKGISCTQTCLAKDNYHSPNDSDVEIDLEEIMNPCSVEACDVADKVKGFIIENIVHGPKSSAELEDPCYCDCECKFGFDKKTTYCGVCGGYEVAGNDIKDKPPYGMPAPPCPIYHNLFDKSKFKINEVSASPDIKTKPSGENVPRNAKASEPASSVNEGASKPSPNIALTKIQTPEKNHSADKKTPHKKSSPTFQNTDQSKFEEKKKIGKFTFNTGYKNTTPHIGHSRCHLPPNTKDVPTGNTNVPRNMGWLWTAEDVPGLKYRPDWRPGAIVKALARRCRQVQGHVDILTRKRKREMKRGKPKKEVKKPALTVKKVDGEYTVQMEILKTFSHSRLPFQYPYEDKAPEVFSVARTAVENKKRLQKKERNERREQRRKSKYIQSTFRNMCEDICMKKYKEAIGLLPKPNPNDPCCPCYPNVPDCFSFIDSCSCNESTTQSSSTETDGNDWVIEFTPPCAKFDPQAKRLPQKIGKETQYSYLDFRVKQFDKNGNPIPRFIIGPDGKKVCTDLGGFWSPDGKKWLQINEDGWVSANDVRWVPNEFIGPDGVVYNSEEGEFVDGDGRRFVIGTDGYIKNGKWYFYPPGPKPPYGKRYPSSPSEDSTWTCLDAYTLPQIISSDFLPHGKDRVKLKERLEERVRTTGSTELKMPTGKIVPYFHLNRLIQNKGMKGLKSKKSSVTFNVKASKTAQKKGGILEARGDRVRSPQLRISQGERTEFGGDRARTLGLKSAGGDRVRSPPVRGAAGERVRSPPGRGTAQDHKVVAGSTSVKTTVGDRGKSPLMKSVRGGQNVGMRSTSLDRMRPGIAGKARVQLKTKREKDSSPSKYSRKSSPGVSSRLAGGGLLDNIDFSKMSERRAKALKNILDPRNRQALETGKKKVCKLARMLADGRHISGHHKDCYGEAAGGCCTEYGGICTEIFKLAHGGEQNMEHEVEHSQIRKASGEAHHKSKSKGKKSADSAGTKSAKPSVNVKGRSKSQSKRDSGEKNEDKSTPLSRREKALKTLMDPKANLGNKKVCKLARMMADGRHLSGHHKDCYGESAGGCCKEYGGICTEIFKKAHER